MKFLSNILIIIALIIYVFFPTLDCGLMGNLTGLNLTEIMINQLGVKYGIISLIPFIASFCAISFNCMKNKYWSIAAIISIIVEISFFYWAYEYVLNLLETVKVNVNTFSWGFSATFWIIIGAIVFAFLALTPIEKMVVNERNKVKQTLRSK